MNHPLVESLPYMQGHPLNNPAITEALKHNGFKRTTHAPDRLWIKTVGNPAGPRRYTAYLTPDGDRLIIHLSQRHGRRDTIDHVADIPTSTDNLQAALHAALK